MFICFFFSSRRRHTRLQGDWSSDVCSSDLLLTLIEARLKAMPQVTNLLTTIGDTSGKVSKAQGDVTQGSIYIRLIDLDRSEERRVGKECRSRWSPYH